MVGREIMRKRALFSKRMRVRMRCCVMIHAGIGREGGGLGDHVGGRK